MKATSIVSKKTNAIIANFSARAYAKRYCAAYVKTGTYKLVPCEAGEVPAGF